MQEDKNRQHEPLDLDERLNAYYGPPLPEQPLSSSAWYDLRLRLAPQQASGSRYRFHWPFVRSRPPLHPSLQEALARVAYEARLPSIPSKWRCWYILRPPAPSVRVAWFGAGPVQLILPLDALMEIGQAEQDVLLATGLARFIGERKMKTILVRLLLIGLALLTGLQLILLWVNHLPLLGLLLALLLATSIVLSLHLQSRAIAFRADRLMVLWLGRARVCSGLHAWADRSRKPGRKRWGEPSLLERIERVCGSGIRNDAHQLTLVH
jgi:hypothetical protein